MIAIFPEIVAAAAQGDIERLAVLARQYFGEDSTYAPQPDVRALLQCAGVPVEILPLDTPGALVAKDEKGSFQIVAIVSGARDEAQSRFLLAHMLGHVLLDILPVIARGEWQASGLRETHCPLKRYAQGGAAPGPAQVGGPEARREDLADRFAAALLMPLGMVRRAYASLQDVGKTAAFFGVPRPCLERRLVDIGAAGVGPVNFLDAERQLGVAAPAVRDGEERSSLSAPEPSMPRSYAASTYGQTERSTRRSNSTESEGAPSRSEARTETRSDTPSPVSSKGMDRLRELAKRLDKAPR